MIPSALVGSLSCRDIINWAAQIMASWARINREGEIELVPVYAHDPQFIAEAILDGDTDTSDGGSFNNYSTPAFDGGVFVASDINFTTAPQTRYDFSVEGDPVVVTGVKYEGESVMYLAGTDRYALDLSDNKLIHEAGISTLLRSIGEKLIGYTYLPYTVNWIGDPAVQAGDLVEHTDRNGRTYRSVVAESKYSYRGASTLTAGGVAESANKYKRT